MKRLTTILLGLMAISTVACDDNADDRTLHQVAIERDGDSWVLEDANGSVELVDEGELEVEIDVDVDAEPATEFTAVPDPMAGTCYCEFCSCGPGGCVCDSCSGSDCPTEQQQK